MQIKAKNFLSKTLYLTFSAIFSLACVILLFRNTQYSYKIEYLLPATAVMTTFLAVIYKGLSRIESFLQKYYYILLGAFLVFMFSVQLFFSWKLRFGPTFDLAAIYEGAIEWIQTGTFERQYEYMCYFPNNLGSMTALYLLFKAVSCLGISDYFRVASVVNSLLCVAAIGCTSLACKKLFSAKAGVFALVLFGVSLPFYFMGAVFYTDFLSIFFPVSIYLLYLYLRSTKVRAKKVGLTLAIGFLAAVGMLIKFTVVIMVIAIGIDWLLRKGWKQTLGYIGTTAIIIGALISGFNGYIYSEHLDRNMAWNYHTPYGHWIMMGLSGTNGGYNPQDYDFTRGTDPEQREEAVKEEILRRIQQRGISGIAELWVNKTNRDFGDGTYALSDFLDDNPEKETALHEYLLYAGSQYEQYSTLTAAVLIAVYIFAAAGGILLFASKEGDISECLTPFLAVFGCWLFLMLWESSGRYFINYIPIIFICAVAGAEQFVRVSKKKEHSTIV